MTHHDAVALFLALGLLLGAARLLGELAQRLGQPAVLGEIVAGILLGPTVFGRLVPDAFESIFPSAGPVFVGRDALMQLAVALFLMAAGMEVDLSALVRRGKTTLAAAAGGLLVPFGLGFACAYFLPDLFGSPSETSRSIFALFIATALSISALPVIAKTLMDMHLFRSDFGMTVIGAAVINDLVGWLCFAIVIDAAASGIVGGSVLVSTIPLTVGFAGLMLSVVRWLLHRFLPVILAYTSWPGGVLAFALTLALFGAAFTAYLGIHALFGSFLVGVALGDSAHLREKTRHTISDFVSYFFAPLFFGSIGLRVDFAAHFELLPCLTVFGLACAGKILGCGLGARWSGMEPRESWALGFALNARGSMEIILGLLALEVGLITPPLFVALVVMALITSLMSAPAIERCIGRKKPRLFVDHLQPRSFNPELRAVDRRAAIVELAQTLADREIPSHLIVDLAWAREQLGPTGIGDGVAVPHARVPGLAAPRIAVGLSKLGIDFDAIDGMPARIVILIATPEEDEGAQLEILSSIGKTLSQPEERERIRSARTYTELCALLKAQSA
jgi:Kef-type K+ transport system membrane component KefB/mannitol/fructose-specific phosphotransferase system IIA component (Ntr-type)